MSAVGRGTSAATLPSVGLWLNASKSESLLSIDDFFIVGFSVIYMLLCHEWDLGMCARCMLTLQNAIFHTNNGKSIVDDFNMKPGVVSMRVVFVLRSAEI